LIQGRAKEKKDPTERNRGTREGRIRIAQRGKIERVFKEKTDAKKGEEVKTHRNSWESWDGTVKTTDGKKGGSEISSLKQQQKGRSLKKLTSPQGARFLGGPLKIWVLLRPMASPTPSRGKRKEKKKSRGRGAKKKRE